MLPLITNCLFIYFYMLFRHSFCFLQEKNLRKLLGGHLLLSCPSQQPAASTVSLLTISDVYVTGKAPQICEIYPQHNGFSFLADQPQPSILGLLEMGCTRASKASIGAKTSFQSKLDDCTSNTNFEYCIG